MTATRTAKKLDQTVPQNHQQSLFIHNPEPSYMNRSSSRNKFTLLYQYSVTDVFVGFRPPCWCPSRWAPAWRLHTNLYKFGRNVSSDILYREYSAKKQLCTCRALFLYISLPLLLLPCETSSVVARFVEKMSYVLTKNFDA